MIFNRYLIPACLIATTVLIAPHQVNAAREARAILAREVGAIAKKTVVRIESSDGGFGSGVIIGRTEKGKQNIYTILTAAHVVRNAGEYSIITPIPLDRSTVKKRQIIKINAQQNIQILRDVDLALVSFESDQTFAIGTIGNSLYADEGSPVYVAGFPQPGRAIHRIAFQFTGGMISSRLDETERDAKEQNNGYDLAYTNITRAGMSGGPVLDVAGRIIAIHGQGDRNSEQIKEENPSDVNSEQRKKFDRIALADGEKTGFNLGIPIQLFLKLQPQSRSMLGAKLDLSPVNYQLTDNSYTMGTKNQKFTKKFRIRSSNIPLFDVTTVNEKIVD